MNDPQLTSQGPHTVFTQRGPTPRVLHLRSPAPGLRLAAARNLGAGAAQAAGARGAGTITPRPAPPRARPSGSHRVTDQSVRSDCAWSRGIPMVTGPDVDRFLTGCMFWGCRLSFVLVGLGAVLHVDD